MSNGISFLSRAWTVAVCSAMLWCLAAPAATHVSIPTTYIPESGATQTVTLNLAFTGSDQDLGYLRVKVQFDASAVSCSPETLNAVLTSHANLPGLFGASVAGNVITFTLAGMGDAAVLRDYTGPLLTFDLQAGTARGASALTYTQITATKLDLVTPDTVTWEAGKVTVCQNGLGPVILSPPPGTYDVAQSVTIECFGAAAVAGMPTGIRYDFGGPTTDYTGTPVGVDGDNGQTVNLFVFALNPAAEAAGNPSFLDAYYVFDKAGPSATTIARVTSSPTNASTVRFTVTFSEDVQNFNVPSDLIVTKTGSVASSGATITGGPQSYTVDVTGVTGDGTMTLAVATGSDVKDLAGNALFSSVTSGQMELDHTSPQASTITPVTPSPTPATTVQFTVHFSESVQRFDAAADLAIAETGGLTHSGATISGGPQDYTVDVTGVTGNGTLTLAVSTTSDVADLAGNALNSSVTSSAVTVDNTAPVALLSNTPPALTNATAIAVTVGGTDVTAYKSKLDDGAWSAETGTGTAITASGLAHGAHTLYVIGRDAIGNWQAEGAATPHTWTIYTTPPNPPVVTGPASPTDNPRPEWTWGSGGGGGAGVYQYQMDGTGDLAWSAATGATSYTPDADLAPGDHALYVRERDTAENWSSSGSASVTIRWAVTVTLKPGWNLVAFPNTPVAEDVAVLLSLVAAGQGWAWDGTVYAPATTLAGQVGYWFLRHGDEVQVTVRGEVASAPPVLAQGWNLIGVSARTAVADVATQVYRPVWGCDAAAGRLVKVESDGFLELGVGYWLCSAAAVPLTGF